MPLTQCIHVSGVCTLPFQKYMACAGILIQAVHLTLNLGMALIPLIISPFLAKHSVNTTLQANSGGNSTVGGQNTSMQWAFLTVAACFWACGLLCLASYLAHKAVSMTRMPPPRMAITPHAGNCPPCPTTRPWSHSWPSSSCS